MYRTDPCCTSKLMLSGATAEFRGPGKEQHLLLTSAWAGQSLICRFLRVNDPPQRAKK